MRLYSLIFVALISFSKGFAEDTSPAEVKEDKKSCSKKITWGGPYLKLELGIGKPEVKTHNIILNEKSPVALDYLAVSPRMFGWDFVCNNNLVIGYEFGFTLGGEATFGYAAEIVPTLGYVTERLKIYLGVGVGYTKGSFKMGYPNKYKEEFEKAGSSRAPFFSRQDSSGGYFVGEVGFDYMVGEFWGGSWFAGLKYQFRRSLTTFQDEDKELYVQQHGIMLNIGIKL